MGKQVAHPGIEITIERRIEGRIGTVRGGVRLKALSDMHHGCCRLPEGREGTAAYSGKAGSAKRSRFDHSGNQHRQTQHIGLDLIPEWTWA